MSRQPAGTTSAPSASLADVVRAAKRFGSQPFFSFLPAGRSTPTEAVSFADYADHALRLASELKSIGVGARSRIALVGRPDLPFVEVLGAALLLGATVLPVNRLLTDREIGAYLDAVGCEFVYADDSTWDHVHTARPAITSLRVMVSFDERPGWRRLDPLAAQQSPRLADSSVDSVDPDIPSIVLHTSGTTAFGEGGHPLAAPVCGVPRALGGGTPGSCDPDRGVTRLA